MSTRAVNLTASRRYQSPNIPLSAIRRYVQQVVEKFQPEKVILFGSYARGDQREGSDVDLLVVMPAWNEISKATRISWELRTVHVGPHRAHAQASATWFRRERLVFA